MDLSTLRFLEPWQHLSAEQAASFLREAQLEIAPGHQLHGLNLVPIAHARLADDVLFKLDDGRIADVHLTWRRGPDPPPWPSTRIFASFNEWSERVMIPDSELE
jgi:hypothetical protein